MTPGSEPPLWPAPAKVRSVTPELDDTVTVTLDAPAGFSPGQFNMCYVFGIGEVPISHSGDPDGEATVHTIRAVGAVSRALCALEPGQTLGLRGPFGSAWPLDAARGRDVLVIAGGIGLAPLRPLLHAIVAERIYFGRVTLCYGAREPKNLLFAADRERWAEPITILLSVDHADADWTGRVGVVPDLIPQAEFDPATTVAYVCGPGIMMRYTARALLDAGLADDAIFVSMERNMHCAVGTCGHCQFGPEFICKDGPVFAWRRVARLIGIREV